MSGALIFPGHQWPQLGNIAVAFLNSPTVDPTLLRDRLSYLEQVAPTAAAAPDWAQAAHIADYEAQLARFIDRTPATLFESAQKLKILQEAYSSIVSDKAALESLGAAYGMSRERLAETKRVELDNLMQDVAKTLELPRGEFGRLVSIANVSGPSEKLLALRPAATRRTDSAGVNLVAPSPSPSRVSLWNVLPFFGNPVDVNANNSFKTNYNRLLVEIKKVGNSQFTFVVPARTRTGKSSLMRGVEKWWAAQGNGIVISLDMQWTAAGGTEMALKDLKRKLAADESLPKEFVAAAQEEVDLSGLLKRLAAYSKASGRQVLLLIDEAGVLVDIGVS